jgi:hypothetical protein
MSVMKALDAPETVYTQDGKKRVTHETYIFNITPYMNPPITVQTVKGLIDKRGQFQAVPGNLNLIHVTLEEFKQLISPTPQGKPAGDFRLSDVLKLIKKRNEVPAEDAGTETKEAAPGNSGSPASPETTATPEAIVAAGEAAAAVN